MQNLGNRQKGDNQNPSNVPKLFFLMSADPLQVCEPFLAAKIMAETKLKV